MSSHLPRSYDSFLRPLESSIDTPLSEFGSRNTVRALPHVFTLFTMRRGPNLCDEKSRSARAGFTKQIYQTRTPFPQPGLLQLHKSRYGISSTLGRGVRSGDFWYLCLSFRKGTCMLFMMRTRFIEREGFRPKFPHTLTFAVRSFQHSKRTPTSPFPKKQQKKDT